MFGGTAPTKLSVSRIAFAGFVTLVVAMGIGRFAFTPLLPMMQDDAGVCVASGGWLAVANYVGYLLGALSAIWMRLSASRAIRAGLLLIGSSTLAVGLVTHFPTWLLLRTVAGIASAWALIFGSAWCLEALSARQRPQLSGIVFGGVGSGIALAGAICLALMRADVSSANAWIIFGALSLILSTMIWPIFGTTRAAIVEQPTSRSRWNREWLRLVLCYGASGFGYIIPATFLPLMAKQVINDPIIFGWSWPVFGVAAFVSTLITATWQHRLSNRNWWAASHVIMAIGVALPALAPHIISIMLAALCVGATFMVIVMVGIGEARDVAREDATHLIAAMTAAFATGQVLGPLSIAFAADNDHFSMALLGASVLLIISSGALMHRPRRTQQRSRYGEIR